MLPSSSVIPVLDVEAFWTVLYMSSGFGVMIASLWMVVLNEYQSRPAVAAAEEAMTTDRAGRALAACAVCEI
jgi:hypothetical protein